MRYGALKATEGGATDKGIDNNGKGTETAPEAPVGKVELFERERPGSGGDKSKQAVSGGGEGDEQFQAMQRAIGVIRQVIAKGIENKLDRENLLDQIREVLGGYRQLRKTEYAETINNFLIRVCQTELSLAIGEAELAELWKKP